jgi:hypothetical protein
MNTPSHRRYLNVALASGVAVFACVSLAHVPGLMLGVAYLGPAVFVFMLLWLGHYPGEKLLVALSRRIRRRRSTLALEIPHRALACLPRGGSLLASSLAGRAPPLSPG